MSFENPVGGYRLVVSSTMLHRMVAGLSLAALVLFAACSGDDTTIGSPVSTTIANVDITG